MFHCLISSVPFFILIEFPPLHVSNFLLFFFLFLTLLPNYSLESSNTNTDIQPTICNFLATECAVKIRNFYIKELFYINS